MIIGLTGPSGAGKSTVAGMFVTAGFRHIDCDAIVHALGNEPAYRDAIAATFGESFLQGGAVDRKKLGALVFSDPAALDRLNHAVAPLISEKIERVLSEAKAAGEDAVLDAPLLFEYALDRICDVTVGVVASEKVLLSRLALRDGKTEAELRGRLASQKPTSFFETACDYVLHNDGDLDALAAAFADMMTQIRTKPNHTRREYET